MWPLQLRNRLNANIRLAHLPGLRNLTRPLACRRARHIVGVTVQRLKRQHRPPIGKPTMLEGGSLRWLSVWAGRAHLDRYRRINRQYIFCCDRGWPRVLSNANALLS